MYRKGYQNLMKLWENVNYMILRNTDFFNWNIIIINKDNKEWKIIKFCFKIIEMKRFSKFAETLGKC